MNDYARQRGLSRMMIPIPLLTPHLSGLWLGLVTPVYARIGRTLVKSIQHPTVVRDNAIERVFGVRPKTLTESIGRALRNEDADMAHTRWCDAISSGGVKPAWGGARLGTRLVDIRHVTTTANSMQAFEPIRRIGGNAGWYYATFLWKLRGALDLMVGGVGMRRGRRHPSDIAIGDTLDFWRVENYLPGRLLLLRAEMKVPGRAWLQFEATDDGAGTRLTQTAIFDSAGILGLIYWYLLYPVHQLIFKNMLREIRRRGLTPP